MLLSWFTNLSLVAWCQWLSCDFKINLKLILEIKQNTSSEKKKRIQQKYVCNTHTYLNKNRLTLKNPFSPVA